jgi:hypothetical protein
VYDNFSHPCSISFRYYLEPASPLKSISTPTSTASVLPQQQPPTITNGTQRSHHSSDSSNLAVLKLTPPAVNNRHHHRTPHHHNELNGNGIHLHNGSSSSTNGSIKSDNSDFVADFSKASIYNSNNSLNSTGSGGHVNGKITNGFSDSSASTNRSDMNANFADFENNKIFVAGELFISLL